MSASMNRTGLLLALVLGIAVGAVATYLWSPSDDGAATAPEQWVARVGDEYISVSRFEDEMRRRGGQMPGQYQTQEQKQALLDEMLYQAALVSRARAEGIDQLPEVRRSIEQILASQVLKRDLRGEQEKVVVSDDTVKAFYEANAESYSVPERRRIAMIRVGVAKGADEAVWKAAEKRVTEAASKAARLDPKIHHFGVVAQEYSDDQASRYRGGVIGWIATEQSERYGQDPVVLKAAAELTTAGQLSAVLRGADAVYVVRLVDRVEKQNRPLSELSAGIQQRLRQERMLAVEKNFRRALIDGAKPTIKSDVLANIQPLSPPASDTPPTPPSLPSKG